MPEEFLCINVSGFCHSFSSVLQLSVMSSALIDMKDYLIQLLKIFEIVIINIHLIQMLGNSLENPFITNAIPYFLSRFSPKYLGSLVIKLCRKTNLALLIV